jgi:hypothetical protein
LGLSEAVDRNTNQPRKEVTMYAVIYSSAGCLPDNDEPEYEGSLAECEAWIMDNEQDYLRPGVAHDLYMLEIIPV